MFKDSKIRKIIHEVGLDNNLPDYVVEDIAKAVFKGVRDTMKDSGVESVRVMGWGVFFPRKWKMNEADRHRK